jgi:rod shape determining protein RodA
MSFEKNFLTRLKTFSHQLPFKLIAVIIAITLVGIAMMYSASNGSFDPWAKKQTIHFAFSLTIMTVVFSINIKFYYNSAYLLYGISILLIIAVELVGYTAMGATRWLKIGVFKLQPSDIVKVTIILALARYFHDLKINKIPQIKSLILPLMIIFLPVAFILKQPDLGTGIIILLISGVILFTAGVRIWKFALVGIATLLFIPIAWNYMHPYQQSRVLIFLNPESEPLGAGYNIMQSKIAIGSAGFFGKGFLKGTQSQLSFLPERHTDFIFTMFAEEWGFLGCALLLAAFYYICIATLTMANNCKSHFGRLMSIGSTALFFIHIIVNVAMVSGLLPVVGAPLPLLSYGGTIMVTTYLAFGLIINAYLHRKINIDKVLKSIF